MLDTVFETIKGKQLRKCDIGSGVPIILLHGYPENLQIYSRLAPLLAARHRVIAFDWPGLGESEAWTGGATPEAQAKRLLQLMQEWKIDKAHLVGADMGGQPALAFAALYPEHSLSVVAMNMLVDGNSHTSWEIKLLRRFKFNRLLLRRFPRLIFARARLTFLRSFHALKKNVRQDLWSSFRQTAVRTFIVRMCAGYEGRLRKLPGLYRKIGCPALILWAEKDKHFPMAQAYRLAEILPQAQLEILPGAQHWMAYEDATKVADKMIAFYSSVSS